MQHIICYFLKLVLEFVIQPRKLEFFLTHQYFFYLVSIELNLFAFLDEEKENYQEIIDRVAKLEKLARLCDENDW